MSEEQLKRWHPLMERSHITVRRRDEMDNAIWHAQKKGTDTILVVSEGQGGLSDGDVRYMVLSALREGEAGASDLKGRFVAGLVPRISLYPVSWLEHQGIDLMVLGEKPFSLEVPIPDSLAPWPGEVVDGNDIAGAGMMNGRLCLSLKEAR